MLQAGLSIGFGDEQRLTCISCTFLGTDNTGNDSSDAQAMVKLLNTSIQCQNLTSSDEIYTHEAEAAQVGTKWLFGPCKVALLHMLASCAEDRCILSEHAYSSQHLVALVTFHIPDMGCTD